MAKQDPRDPTDKPSTDLKEDEAKQILADLDAVAEKHNSEGAAESVVMPGPGTAKPFVRTYH